MSEGRKAVFLDRDGVLNDNPGGFITEVRAFSLLPGVPQALARLTQAGYLNLVITNQSGIGRGLLPLSILEEMHRLLKEKVAQAGGKIDGIYYCPHPPEEECVCRKPSPYLILQAVQDLNICLEKSFLIGDSERDILAGRRAGCKKSFLVLSGNPEAKNWSCWENPPDGVFKDLPEAVEWILTQEEPTKLGEGLSLRNRPSP